jgi:hypothetical protein
MPKGASIPISGSATLMVSEGHAELKGIFIVSGSRRDDS